MKKIALVALLLAACVEYKPTEWKGIPTENGIACGEIYRDTATCVASSRVYTCVFSSIGGSNVRQLRATCGVISALVPAEAPEAPQ